jgi:hypothetical protein
MHSSEGICTKFCVLILMGLFIWHTYSFGICVLVAMALGSISRNNVYTYQVSNNDKLDKRNCKMYTLLKGVQNKVGWGILSNYDIILNNCGDSKVQFFFLLWWASLIGPSWNNLIMHLNCFVFLEQMGNRLQGGSQQLNRALNNPKIGIL